MSRCDNLNTTNRFQIPKIIHYCWFGGNPLPESALEYINTWKKYCPDYEIIQWDETNFDVSSNTYTYEAYLSKKWAFITDYVRLYALYNYGGIYMDTDVEVLKNLDKLLEQPAFSGFESSNLVPTGIMGSTVKNPWIEYLLSYYHNRHFIVGGDMDLTPNTITITQMTMEKYGLKLNDTLQSFENHLIMYPHDYFCPKDVKTGIISCTKNTYTIHHFAASWCDDVRHAYNTEKKEIISRYPWLRNINNTKIGCFLLGKIIPAWAVCNVSGIRVLMTKIAEEFKR